MDLDETLAPAGSGMIENAVEPYSAGWWQNLSTEELRGLIDGGFGTAAFEGASLEAERRARKRREAEEAAERAEAARKKRLRLMILEGFLLFFLVALIATELMR